MCYLGVTLLLAWGRLGSISAPFGEPASRFTSAIERSGIWKEDSNGLAQFGATERSPSMYIRMRVLPWVTLLLGQVGINFSSFGEPASRFTSAMNVREYGRG
jgi:hypothetical protein